MSVALLDVNVLVALFREAHVHHEIAHDWFADHSDLGWASCPLTENGMVRILSAPGHADRFVMVPELVELLQRVCANVNHHFWPDDVSIRDRDLFNVRRIHGHRQLTDVYLLGLAIRHGGRLVTLDSGVPLAAVHGARPENLVVLAPAE